MNLRERLEELGHSLPPPPPPAANYAPLVEHGRLLYVSGQLPIDAGGALVAAGKVGAGVDLDTARACARCCVLNALAQLDRHLGPDGLVERVLKVGVYVASAPGFTEQHRVADAASDLLVAVWGEAGRHARAAVGCVSLPKDAPVEVELLAAAAPGRPAADA